MSHPCRNCGACCAYFRVEFYWREVNDSDSSKPVPLALTEPSGPHTNCMKGTNKNHQVRCVALQGKVGKTVGCSIYENRASPCRNFLASFENGEENERCNHARKHYGLAPLTEADWS